MSLQDVLDRIAKQSQERKAKEYAEKRLPVSSVSSASALAGLPPGLVNAVDVNTPTVSIPQQPKVEKKPYNLFDEISSSAMKLPGTVLSQGLDMAAFVSGSPVLSEASRQTGQRIAREYPTTAPELSSVEAFKKAGVTDVLKYGLSQVHQVPASMISMAIPSMAAMKLAGPVAALAQKAPAMGRFIKFIGGAEKAAELASLVGGSTLLEAGSIATDVQGQAGYMPDRLDILPSAIFAGSLEAIPVGKLLGRLKKVNPGLAKQAAGLTGNAISKFVADAAVSMGLEGGTEFIQTLIEEAGAKVGMGQEYGEAYSSTVQDPESIARAKGAGISGAFGGGVSSSVTSVIENLQKKKQSDVAPADPVVTFEEPKITPTPKPTPKTDDQSFNQADVGENQSVADSEIKAFRESIIDTFSVIGVNDINSINEVVSGAFGKNIDDLDMQELEKLRDFVFDMIAKDNKVQSEIPAMGIEKTIEQPGPQKTDVPARSPQNLFEAVMRAQETTRERPTATPDRMGMDKVDSMQVSEPVSLQEKLDQIKSGMTKTDRTGAVDFKTDFGPMTPKDRQELQITPQKRQEFTDIKQSEVKMPEQKKKSYYYEPFPAGGFTVKDQDDKQIGWVSSEKAAVNKVLELNAQLKDAEQEAADAKAEGLSPMSETDADNLFGNEPGTTEKRRVEKEQARKEYDTKIKTEGGLNQISDKDYQFLNFKPGFGKTAGKEFATEKYIALDKDGAERDFTLKVTRDEKTGEVIKKEVTKGNKTREQVKKEEQQDWDSLPADVRNFVDSVIPENRKDLVYPKTDLAKQITGDKFPSGIPIGTLFGGHVMDDDAFVRKTFGDDFADNMDKKVMDAPKMLEALKAKFEGKKTDETTKPKKSTKELKSEALRLEHLLDRYGQVETGLKNYIADNKATPDDKADLVRVKDKIKETKQKIKEVNAELKSISAEQQEEIEKEPAGKTKTLKFSYSDVDVTFTDQGTVEIVNKWHNKKREPRKRFLAEKGYVVTSGEKWTGTEKQFNVFKKKLYEYITADENGENYQKVIRPLERDLKDLVDSVYEIKEKADTPKNDFFNPEKRKYGTSFKKTYDSINGPVEVTVRWDMTPEKQKQINGQTIGMIGVSAKGVAVDSKTGFASKSGVVVPDDSMETIDFVINNFLEENIKTKLDVGEVGNINIPNLAEALVPEMEKLLEAEKPMDNRQLKKILKELGIDVTKKDYNHKITQEAVESAMVQVVRKNQLQNQPDKLIKLYKNQPVLRDRTGASIANQAYSTPIPLVGMVTQAIGAPSNGAVVYEPTAGNGLLLSGIQENQEGTLKDYVLNELDKTRHTILKSLFPKAKLTSQDAMEFNPDQKADFIFTNPPFGSLKSFGKSNLEVFPVGEAEFKNPITFRQIDHAIAYKALENMKDDGKAVIVIGAELIKSKPDLSKISGNNKVFLTYLYNQYNVTGHFEVSGKLYSRQGADWPVSIITLEGRKSFPKNYVTAPKSVERATNWDEVKELTGKIKPGSYLSGANRTRISTVQGDKQETGGDRAVKDDGGDVARGIESETRSENIIGTPTADVGRAATGQPVSDLTSNTEQIRDTTSAEYSPVSEEVYKEREDNAAAAKPVVGRLDPDDVSGPVGEESELQASYKPVSGFASVNTLVPVNLQNPIRHALESLSKKVKDTLENFVAKKLGYKSSKQLINPDGRSILSAEQIDAVSLAISAIEQGGGAIIADQTGVGKGRSAAACIAYASKTDNIPIFLTEKASLFSDIYRDLKAIREEKLRPFIFNSDGRMEYTNDAGEKTVAYKHVPSEYSKTFKKIQKGDFSDFGPDGKYDYIAATYSQFADKSSKKLQALINQTSKKYTIVMDESHNAAGVSQGKQSNQGKNISSLISPEITSGVVYLSATWAKRPEMMIVYNRAFGKGKASIDEIMSAFERGGVAMQEMMVTSMARQGSYIRREQSFKGVTFQRSKTPVKSQDAKRENDKAEKTMELLRKVTKMGGVANSLMVGMDTSALDIPDDFVGGDVDSSGNSVTTSVDVPTSPFSQVHNYVSSFVTSLKSARAAVNAIDAIKKGQKPVIVIKNTMESQMNALLELGKAQIGQGFSGTFSDVLDLIQEKILTITVKSNFDSKKKISVKVPLERFPIKFQEQFKALKQEILKSNLDDMPFSPIDYVKSEIKKAGYSIGELTARGKYLDYENMQNGKPTLTIREPSEYNQAGRLKVVKEFNDGRSDALILNQSGSTGISIHSSETVKDQRQRIMFILQAFDDINTFMQMVGRIHRVGAVVNESKVSSVVQGKPATYGYPGYRYLQSSLGMEIRTGIQLENKMKSLNAQTSSNEKGHQSVADVDVMNKYGKEIMVNWLFNHRKLMNELDLDKDAKVERITGRMALAPQQSQNEFWSDVVLDYKEKIAELDAAGENDLVVPTFEDAEAETISKKLIYGEEGNPERPPVYFEVIEMTISGNPTSLEGARQRAEKAEALSEKDFEERDKMFEEFIKKLEQLKKDKPDSTQGIDINKVKVFSNSMKDRIKELSLGDIYNDTDRGWSVITKIGFKKPPANYISNPYSPGLVSIEMSAPNKSGKILTSLSGLIRSLSQKSGNVLKGVNHMIKQSYEKQYQGNKTKRIETSVLTGDMIKAQSMNSGTIAVQFGRKDGSQDFGWLNENYQQKESVNMIINSPTEVLSDDQIENEDIYYSVSMDGTSVHVRPATEVGTDVYGYREKEFKEIPGDRKTKPFEIWVAAAKSSKYGRQIYSNQKLLDLISDGDQDAVFKKDKRAKIDKKTYLKTGHIDPSKRPAALKIINNILKGSASGLTKIDTGYKVMGAKGEKEVSSDSALGQELSKGSRRGSIGFGGYNPSLALKELADYTKKQLYSYVESAYNFLVRGGGSLAKWIKSVPDRIRNETPGIWKLAKTLVAIGKALNKALGKRGGVIRLSELTKALKKELQDIAEKEGKPQPSQETDKAVETGMGEAHKTGKADQRVVQTRILKRTREQARARERKLKDKIKDFREEVVKKKNIDREQKQFLLSLVKKLPVNYQARLSGQIARADTVQKASDLINKIDDLLNEVSFKKAKKRMESAIKEAVKLRPEFQELADAFKDGIESNDDIYGAIDSMLDYIEENNVAFVDDNLKAAAETLVESEADSITKESMDLIAELFEQVKYQSDLLNKKLFSGEVESIKEYADKVKAHLPSEETAELKDNGKRGMLDWIFNIGLMDYDAVVSLMGDAGHDLFYMKMKESEAKFKEVLFQGKDNLTNVLEKNDLEYGKSTVAWLDKDTKISTEKGDVSLTRGEKMNLVANLMDKSTREVIVGKPARKKKRGKGMTKPIKGVGIKIGEVTHQITDMQADLIINSLDEKEKSVVDSLRSFLNGELKKEANRVWVKLAGFEKALSDDYWPRVRDFTYTGLNEGFKKWAASALENLGMWKQRTRSNKAVVINDVMTTYENHINKASNFIGFAETLRNIEIAFGAGGLSEALEKKFGKQYVQRIKDQLNAVAMGVKVGNELEDFYSRALRRIAGGKISGNVRVAARQYGGLFTATTELGFENIVSSLNSIIDAGGKVDSEMIENSPIIRDRYESAAERIVSPLFETGETWLGRGRSKVDEATRLLAIPFQKADRSVSRVIWSAAKKEVRKKFPNIRGKEFMDKVARRTEQVISRTQNVTSVLDYSGVALMSKKNPLAKTITTFQSQGNSIYNVLRRTFRDYSKGKIGIEKVAANLLMANVANTMLSLFMGGLTFRGMAGEEDKDFFDFFKNRARKAWNYLTLYNVLEKNLGMIYGSNVARPFIRKLKKIASSGKYSGGRVNIENLSQSDANDIFNSVIDIANSRVAKKTETQKKLLNKGLFNLFQGVVGVAGGPVTITREGFNVYNLVNKK